MKQLFAMFLTLACASAFAQAPTQAPSRIRGTITKMEGNVMSVKTREGKAVTITLAPDTTVSVAKKATLAELKDKYVGVTSEEKDGKLVALEVHAIPPAAPAGHMPWDLKPNTGMTNANLATQAKVTGGNEITMKYKDGEKKILVPAKTPVVKFEPGTVADLKKGEHIFTIAKMESEGKYATGRVSVSKGGVKPPQ
jgi:antitoxin component of MazEF toxin-antitoxin module